MTEFFVLAQGAAAPAAQPVTAAPAATQGKTTAPANGNAAPPQSAFGGLMGMLPMIIIIVAMFYLMWRGQAKERKKRETMLSAIKNGDRVVTIGGIYGTVVEVKNEGFILKISDNVKIEITKNAVGSVVTTGEVAAK